MNKTTLEQELARRGRLIYVTKGVSMRPFIRSGEDLVEITAKGTDRFRKYDVVLYRRGAEYVLHRIVKVREGDYVIRGDNCLETEYGIPDDRILGVLTGIVRQGKRLDIHAPGYGLRVKLWVALHGPRALYMRTRKYLGKVWRTLIGKQN